MKALVYFALLSSIAASVNAQTCQEAALEMMFLRTLDEFRTDAGSRITADFFNRQYQIQNKSEEPQEEDQEEALEKNRKEKYRPGELAQADILEIADEIENAVMADIIETSCASIAEAAFWRHDPNCESNICGEMRVSEATFLYALENFHQAQGVEESSARKLLKQEQLADSLLHETAHAFQSYFSKLGLKTTLEPENLTTNFPKLYFWNGRGPRDFGPEMRLAPGLRLSKDISYSAKGGEETARRIAFFVLEASRDSNHIEQAVARILGLELASPNSSLNKLPKKSRPAQTLRLPSGSSLKKKATHSGQKEIFEGSQGEGADNAPSNATGVSSDSAPKVLPPPKLKSKELYQSSPPPKP